MQRRNPEHPEHEEWLAEQREYRKNNIERIHKNEAQSRERRKSYITHDMYRERNREKLREKARQKYAETKEQKREYSKQHREKNKEHYLIVEAQRREKNRIATNKKNKIRRTAIKKQCLDYLGGAICKRCKIESEYLCIYDFHHKEDTIKLFGISSKISMGWTFQKLKLELDKCDVYCKNCHQIIHYITGE